MRRRTIALSLAGVLATGAVVAFLGRRLSDDVVAHARVVKTADNLRALSQLFVSDGVGVSKPWPRLEGKRLVLYLAAAGLVDTRDERLREVLFSNSDTGVAQRRAAGEAAYRGLGLAILGSSPTDVSGLTSFVGRRIASSSDPAPTSARAHGAPLFADLTFGSFAIVSFADGSVRQMTKAELGLGPDDPLVVGDASKSPLLRQLVE